jgi:hypothetical protein
MHIYASTKSLKIARQHPGALRACSESDGVGEGAEPWLPWRLCSDGARRAAPARALPLTGAADGGDEVLPTGVAPPPMLPLPTPCRLSITGLSDGCR